MDCGACPVTSAPPPRSRPPSARWLIPALGVLFVPLWSSGFIVGKIATAHMQVPAVLLWRFVGGLVVMGAGGGVAPPAPPPGRGRLPPGGAPPLLQGGQVSFVYTSPA